MNIANCDGDFECHTWIELKNFIQNSSLKPFDDIWLCGNREYPCLTILLNGTYACVHYFLNSDGDMWQSVGYGDQDVSFMINGDRTDMPANCIITLDKALECAEQFYNNFDKPTCIEWREL